MSDHDAQVQARLLSQRAPADPPRDGEPGEAEPTVCVVLVTYNADRWLANCLRGLNNQLGIKLHIVVVDNASTDGTREALRSLKSQGQIAEVCLQDTNLGYAAAANVGFRQVLAQGADFALLLNQDAELFPGAVAELVAVARSEPRLGPISPLHVSQDRAAVEAGCWWFLRLSTQFLADGESGAEFKRAYEVYFVNGAIMLMSRQLLEQVGLFDELFFFYGEDNDYCRRCLLVGWQPAVAAFAHAFHWHGSVKAPDLFRRSNRRKADYSLILKKPSRPFAVSFGAAVAKCAADLFQHRTDLRESIHVVRDFGTTLQKVPRLWQSRREDLKRTRTSADQ